MNEQFRGGGHVAGEADPRHRGTGDRRYYGYAAKKNRSPGRSLRCFAAILLLILVSCIPVSGAGEVTLSTPQSSYYFRTGEEAVIPLTLASTYGHDVTGTVRQSMTRLHSAGSGSRDMLVQSRAFSAFTEQRTVSLPVGRSDVPADYLLTIVFSYDENGARTAILSGITIHFVTTPEDTPPGGRPLTGTDTADPVAGTSSAGTAPAGQPKTPGPAAALQNSQMAQDTSALRNQMAEESNRSEEEENELLGTILADPLVVSRSRSLTGAGFTLNRTGIAATSNRSGSFLLTYSSGPKNAAIAGSILDSRVRFAEESSDVPVPLPEALPGNATYQAYAIRVTEYGFTMAETRINSTFGNETVDLTYTGPRDRRLRMHAGLVNGSVVMIEGESPEDPLAAVIPLVALASVILMSAGIWYLARSHRADPAVPVPAIPAPAIRQDPREIALQLLDEAERDAARDSWPDAYRKTGRAIRIVLSHEVSHGEELTGEELARLIGTSAGNTEKILWILDRCMTVGFAKDTPEPGEFREMIGYSRALVTGGSSGDKGPDTKR